MEGLLFMLLLYVLLFSSQCFDTHSVVFICLLSFVICLWYMCVQKTSHWSHTCYSQISTDRHNQPLCDECKCSFTVKNILLEWHDLTDIHEKYFTCSSLKELLIQSVDATAIIDVIKETNFHHLVYCYLFTLFFTLAIIALFLLINHSFI